MGFVRQPHVRLLHCTVGEYCSRRCVAVFTHRYMWSLRPGLRPVSMPVHEALPALMPLSILRKWRIKSGPGAPTWRIAHSCIECLRFWPYPWTSIVQLSVIQVSYMHVKQPCSSGRAEVGKCQEAVPRGLIVFSSRLICYFKDLPSSSSFHSKLINRLSRVYFYEIASEIARKDSSPNLLLFSYCIPNLQVPQPYHALCHEILCARARASPILRRKLFLPTARSTLPNDIGCLRSFWTPLGDILSKFTT